MESCVEKEPVGIAKSSRRFLAREGAACGRVLSGRLCAAMWARPHGVYSAPLSRTCASPSPFSSPSPFLDSGSASEPDPRRKDKDYFHAFAVHAALYILFNIFSPLFFTFFSSSSNFFFFFFSLRLKCYAALKSELKGIKLISISFLLASASRVISCFNSRWICLFNVISNDISLSNFSNLFFLLWKYNFVSILR